jgi:hypothetical protein
MDNKEKNCCSGNSYGTFEFYEIFNNIALNFTKSLISINPSLNPIYYPKNIYC